jgi:hypothetical protein
MRGSVPEARSPLHKKIKKEEVTRGGSETKPVSAYKDMKLNAPARLSHQRTTIVEQHNYRLTPQWAG